MLRRRARRPANHAHHAGRPEIDGSAGAQAAGGPPIGAKRGAFRLGEPTAFKRILVEGVEDAVAAAMAGAGCVCAGLGVAVSGAPKCRCRPSPWWLATMIPRARRPPWRSGAASRVSFCTAARLSITARAGTLHPGGKDIADLSRVDVALARQFLDTAKGVADRLDEAEREALLEEVSKAPGMPTSATARRSPLRCIGAPGRSTRSAAGGDRLAPASPIRSRAVSSGSPGRSRSTDLGAVLDAAADRGEALSRRPGQDLSRHHGALGGARASLAPEELGVGFTPRLAFQSPDQALRQIDGAQVRLSDGAPSAHGFLDLALFVVSCRRCLRASRSSSMRATTSSRPPAPSCSPSSIPALTG